LNPEWRDAKPAFPSSIVRFIPDPLTSRLALDKRDVDAVLDPLEPELREMAQRPDVRLVHGPSDAVLYLAFDTTRPPFSSEALRRAVEEAVDARALAQFFGPDVTAARGFLPPGLPGAEPGFAAPQRKLDAAKALVRAASLAGASIPFYYSDTPSVLMPDPPSVANEIRSELAAANLNVDARPTAGPIVLPAAGAGGGLALVVGEARSGDPDELFEPLDTEWSDSTFHTLIGSGRATLGEPARVRTYRKLNALIHDHVVVVPLVHPFAWSAVRARVDLDAYPIFAGRR
jgi:dipeptide transport system substrate-binding protein